MSGLTEREILAQLKESLRLAAEMAYKLSQGERGPIYVQFRAQIKLAEGCCRQMAGWREDTRWLPFGMKLAEAWLRCGQWLREKQPSWRFKGLAEILAVAAKDAFDLETKKTGKKGIILPKTAAPEIRTQDRPVQVILPPGFVRSPAESVH